MEGTSMDWITQLGTQGPLVAALGGMLWWMMRRIQKADESAREERREHIDLIKKLGGQIERNTLALERFEGIARTCEAQAVKAERALSNPGSTA